MYSFVHVLLQSAKKIYRYNVSSEWHSTGKRNDRYLMSFIVNTNLRTRLWHIAPILCFMIRVHNRRVAFVVLSTRTWSNDNSVECECFGI